MELVSLYREEDGRRERFLDPRPYLAGLPDLADRLPPGARAFATDPAHYDFGGPRCVKDLRPVGAAMRPGENGLFDLTLTFEPNPFKHDEGLTVTYSGVSSFGVEADGRWTGASGSLPGLGDVTLDEVLPHGHGCSHEIGLLGGRVLVVAGDLAAVWG
ncbi:hypothetical protein PWG71_03395 [Nocardiopsis sp. N85]|uniref:hypothetical protein n=1 Tax=Nocardiopsis sp. N85 TaxID=3029400 RepID=UPI00237F5A17|nr:hypothetical protein [Nocardiopsis sp. N85]MDE3720418.1 hypothetical protein [Nocardiopsis sp. N85]